ncbi:MAG: helix-turn-helix transcriptional regulator, partial [Erysipelotrichaceae bacterium]|nr:helix-turn-helix transcriptional regulator [Erysipelotrichaceae bacterium]
MDLGKRVKQLRIKSGMTLEELASRTELTKGFLSQLERNLSSPSIATLEDIVEVLGVSLADFFRDSDETAKITYTYFRKKSFYFREVSGYIFSLNHELTVCFNHAVEL